MRSEAASAGGVEDVPDTRLARTRASERDGIERSLSLQLTVRGKKSILPPLWPRLKIEVGIGTIKSADGPGEGNEVSREHHIRRVGLVGSGEDAAARMARSPMIAAPIVSRTPG